MDVVGLFLYICESFNFFHFSGKISSTENSFDGRIRSAQHQTFVDGEQRINKTNKEIKQNKTNRQKENKLCFVPKIHKMKS